MIKIQKPPNNDLLDIPAFLRRDTKEKSVMSRIKEPVMDEPETADNEIRVFFKTKTRFGSGWRRVTVLSKGHKWVTLQYRKPGVSRPLKMKLKLWQWAEIMETTEKRKYDGSA